MNRTRCLELVGCVLAVLLSARGSTFAQAHDKAANALRLDRENYEQAMEKVREDVLKAIESEQRAANKRPNAKGDVLRKLEAERQAFLSTGAWPETPDAKSLQRRYEAITKRMGDSFRAAIAAYGKDKNDDLCDSVQNEFTRFERQSDLVPWSDNLLAKDALDRRALAPDAAPLAVATGMTGDYRVEVLGENGAGNTLVLEIPLPPNSMLAVPVSNLEQNSWRVMLSVSERKVSADLGAKRPIDLAKAVDGLKDSIVLKAVGGPFVVTSIRVKPIVPGLGEGNQRPEGAKAELLPVGSRWKGSQTEVGIAGQSRIDGIVTRRDANEVEFLTTTNGTTKLRWTLTTAGDAVTLTSATYENIKGTLAEVGGTGNMDGKRLRWTYECRVTSGNLRNQKREGTIELEREN